MNYNTNVNIDSMYRTHTLPRSGAVIHKYNRHALDHHQFPFPGHQLTVHV